MTEGMSLVLRDGVDRAMEIVPDKETIDETTEVMRQTVAITDDMIVQEQAWLRIAQRHADEGTFIDGVRDRLDSLSDNQRAVAEYLLRNREKLAESLVAPDGHISSSELIRQVFNQVYENVEIQLPEIYLEKERALIERLDDFVRCYAATQKYTYYSDGAGFHWPLKDNLPYKLGKIKMEKVPLKLKEILYENILQLDEIGTLQDFLNVLISLNKRNIKGELLEPLFQLLENRSYVSTPEDLLANPGSVVWEYIQPLAMLEREFLVRSEADRLNAVDALISTIAGEPHHLNTKGLVYLSDDPFDSERFEKHTRHRLTNTPPEVVPNCTPIYEGIRRLAVATSIEIARAVKNGEATIEEQEMHDRFVGFAVNEGANFEELGLGDKRIREIINDMKKRVANPGTFDRLLANLGIDEVSKTEKALKVDEIDERIKGLYNWMRLLHGMYYTGYKYFSEGLTTEQRKYGMFLCSLVMVMTKKLNVEVFELKQSIENPGMVRTFERLSGASRSRQGVVLNEDQLREAFGDGVEITGELEEAVKEVEALAPAFSLVNVKAES